MRPEELSKLSKAAAEMEKRKLADKKKLAEFVSKTPELAGLVDDCYICTEPLLNNIGTSEFGVVSWHCRCTVAQKAHSACLFSKICHGDDMCDMCSSPMRFASPRANRSGVMIQFLEAGDSRSGASRNAQDQDQDQASELENYQQEEIDNDDDDEEEEQEQEEQEQEEGGDEPQPPVLRRSLRITRRVGRVDSSD